MESTNYERVNFLANIVPFSFLPEDDLEWIASHMDTVQYPKNMVLFVQGHTEVEFLYIVLKGAAERYFEDKDKKKLSGILGEGEMYGGISMLVNNSLAVRTLKLRELTWFYTIPREIFLKICMNHPSFSEFFTDTFGKRMLDRSYAEFIGKAMRPKEDSTIYFNQPVAGIYKKDLVFCNMSASIREAASLMTIMGCSSIFIKDSDGDYVGIVTDNDLRRKVVATGYDIEKPISTVMSSPLAIVSSHDRIFEALMYMMQADIKHLGVTDSDGKVIGIISHRDLLNSQSQAPFFFLRKIVSATTLEEIFEKQEALPGIIRNLINSGAKANNVTKMITTISDAILEKLVEFALDELGSELGPPPAKFAFMILGSEGRGEQTLKTDQDNAIIFEDVPKDSEEDVRNYFLAFGEKVCTWLDKAGYDFCKGDVMAKNPKWCQPLSQWKTYFSGWIHAAEAEDLLNTSIFFDFRGAYGEMPLVDELKSFLFKSLVGWAGFFRHLTENALHFKAPLGFFRNFVVESKGEHRDSFDIKSAMMPLVDFARIYALDNAIDETNTLKRLHRLYLKGVLTWEEYSELEQAYAFMMQLRFVRQITSVIEEKQPANNYVNPKKLSIIEQKMLKEIFKRIEKYQSKLIFDFIGLI